MKIRNIVGAFFLLAFVFACVGSPQHPSVTIVGIDYGNGSGGRGSGVIVENDEDGVTVLTAKHVVRGRGRVWCNPPGTGRRFFATSVKHHPSIDISWFRVPQKGLEGRDPMPVYEGTLEPGQTVYSEGFGTTSNWPTEVIGRPLWEHNGYAFGRLKGSVQQTRFVNQSIASYSLPSIPGDSGAPIYVLDDGQPHLVGITSSSDWGTGRPTHTTGCRPGPIRHFLQHVIFGRSHPAPYQGYQCPPGQPCPPQQRPQPQPQLERIPQPPTEPPDQSIDTDQLKDELLEQMAQDERFRGPQGPRGPAGKDGKRGPRGPAGPPGATPEVDIASIAKEAAGMITIPIAQIAEEAANRMPDTPIAVEDPETGEQEELGTLKIGERFVIPFKRGSESEPSHLGHVRHLVLVVDKTSEYWPSMEQLVARARGYYSGIRIAEPPDFSVPLPQIIGYRDGDPVKPLAIGQREVSTLLTKIVSSSFEEEW